MQGFLRKGAVFSNITFRRGEGIDEIAQGCKIEKE